jgi:hypothetical protein
MQEHVAFWWPESGEPGPPEAKAVTQEAWDEYKRLRLAEEKAQEEFARINRVLLRGS